MVAVVERNGCGQAEQFAFVLAFGADSAAVFADEPSPLRRRSFRQTNSGLVWPGFTARRPKYKDSPLFDVIYPGNRMIIRLYGGISEFQQFLLY